MVPKPKRAAFLAASFASCFRPSLSGAGPLRGVARKSGEPPWQRTSGSRGAGSPALSTPAADSHSHALEAAAPRPGSELPKSDPAQDVGGSIWLTVHSHLGSAASVPPPADVHEEASAPSSALTSPHSAPGLLISTVGTRNPATPVPEEGSHHSRSTPSTQDDLPDLPASPAELASGLPSPASEEEVPSMMTHPLSDDHRAGAGYTLGDQGPESRASTESESTASDVGAAGGRPAGTMAPGFIMHGRCNMLTVKGGLLAVKGGILVTAD